MYENWEYPHDLGNLQVTTSSYDFFGGTTKIHHPFIGLENHGKPSSYLLDENWGYPHDLGKRHIFRWTHGLTCL